VTVAAHRMNNDLRYREADHPSQTWFTPSYVLDPVRVDLGGSIDLDPCTTEDNPVGARSFYTVTDDGLTKPWSGIGGEFGWLEPSVYVNPPYSKAREPWVNRCIEAGERGQRVILLIPAATDTRIFQKAVETSTAVVFVKGRVKFGVLRPNRRQVAASHPSALIGWNTGLVACSTLGLVTRAAA
jgi:phage N-6-adenine-methyltransferase